MALEQLYTLMCFILTGITIGILFDIFRIIRKSFKTFDIITYIEDFLFWCIAGFILLCSIFIFNDGELRAYLFIGIILGIIFYFLTFSKYIVKILVTILTFIKDTIKLPLKKYIIRPFHYFFSKIKDNMEKNKKNKLKKDKIVNKF